MSVESMTPGASAILGGRFHAVTIAGHQFECHYKTLGDYAETEAFILSRRQHPLETLRQVRKSGGDFDPDVLREMIGTLCELSGRAQMATASELIDYKTSPIGWGHRLWQATRHKPEQLALIPDAATGAGWFIAASPDERDRLRLVLSGEIEEGDLGNSSGPTAVDATP